MRPNIPVVLWRSNALVSLRSILLLAFKETRETSYLDESIAVGYDILKSESAQDCHYREIMWLVYSLNTRSLLSGRTEDLLEALRLIPMAVNNQYTPEPDRFEFSCQWAMFARSISHPTTLTAYKSAMSLIEKSLSFAPTVSIQHARLVAMGILCQTISLDYASFQIELGRFEEAVETLEQGRALLWSEMRGLNTPMAQLIEDLPSIKNSRYLTISITADWEGQKWETASPRISDAMDPFGRLVVRRQKLVEERDTLVSQIRSLPGLEGFLNRGEEAWSRLKVITRTLYVLYWRASYELVGEPVIEKLRLSGVPEQSRIWWCPTSWKNPRYYLLPNQTDSLPGVKGEIRVIRSLEPRVTVADLVSSEATPSSVVEGLRSSHFAHFACHGVLETGKPFDASFKLHGGSRLTLLDIARSRLPDAELAFLSCCHAAEVTGESIADEALHLTAAMQYCGFRSVVGTMWEMADTDGRDLAKSFYKSLFSSQETSVPYYERSAGALRDATQKLRGKRGITLERWVLVLEAQPRTA
ncbi:CHAT domain-containing protein, partial [Lactarius indigo]